jgi:hypothetical protein
LDNKFLSRNGKRHSNTFFRSHCWIWIGPFLGAMLLKPWVVGLGLESSRSISKILIARMVKSSLIWEPTSVGLGIWTLYSWAWKYGNIIGHEHNWE